MARFLSANQLSSVSPIVCKTPIEECVMNENQFECAGRPDGDVCVERCDICPPPFSRSTDTSVPVPIVMVVGVGFVVLVVFVYL